MAVLAVLYAAAAPAQVQRTFVNLGFEQPSAGTATCYFQVGESAVPGWTTNHPSGAGAGCAPNVAAAPGPLIEIWANGFSGVVARSGRQFAELNAEASARIYQNVCLAGGEPIGWRFSHRGRQSTTVRDKAEFRIGSAPGVNRVVLAQTTNNGSAAQTCYGTAASATGVGGNTCANAAAPNGWRDYSGDFLWNGATGVQAIGFEAIEAAGGTTIGNFIDDIQVTLRPFVELTSASASVREGSTDALPALRVVGTVPAGGIAVQLAIGGGTAARGSDYTTASGDATLSVSVPAGVYDGTNFPLPLTLLDDAAIEDNETIALAITSSPTNYVLSSTRVCGAAPITATTLTLLDNDADLAVSLDAPASARAGGPLVYTATYHNRTAAPTTGDAASRTIATLLAEAVPVGLTLHGWTCAASGGARCPGGAPDASVAGSGAVAGPVTLPAGASVSFSVGATIAPTQCTAIALTAQVAMPAGFGEGTSVQAGYTTPAPGGAANNSATASVASLCNAAPVASAASVAVASGGSATIALHASDADGDALTWRVVTPPQHGTLSGTAPALTYTPDAAYVGSDTFTFVANDGTVDSQPATIAITVTAANRAPAIAGDPPSQTPERGTYAPTLAASDPDAGDTQAWRLVRAPSGMTIGASSGTLAWPADGAMVGSSALPNSLCYGGGTSVSAVPAAADIVTVVDESGSMTGEHAWIADIAVPFQAYLAASGVGDGGEPNRYGLTAFTQEPRTIALGAAPFGDHRGLIAATQRIHIPEFGGTEDGWRAIMHALTQYPWRATAARNVLFISDEDRDMTDPSLSYASVLAALAERKTMLNVVVNARFRCGDASAAMGIGPDGVGYKVDGAGGHTTCANATATAAASGDTTIADYVNLALATGGAAWDIEVLRDGGHYAESFTDALIALKVREILSQQPTAEQADLAVSALRVENRQVHVTVVNRGLAPVTRAFVTTLAADGTAFASVTVDSLGAGASVERSVDWPVGLAEPAQIGARIDAPGTVECKADNNDLAAAWVRARVEDGAGLADERAFSVSVSDVNDAPDIGSTAPATVALDDRYVYAVSATDPDRGDALEYRLDSAPDGMTIDRLTGVVRWQPAANQAGAHAIVVRVQDLAGLADTQSYTLTVGAGRAPPRFTSTPNRRAVQGETYTYAATASGEPDAVLRYTLVDGPAGMAMDAVTGVVSWGAPADFDDDAERIALRVNDQYGGYHLQFYTLYGDLPDTAPAIATQPPTRHLTETALSYVASATDVNLFETQSWAATLVPSGASLTMTGTPPLPVLNLPGVLPASVLPAELATFNRQCVQTDPAVRPFQPVQGWRVTARLPSTRALVGPLADTNADGRLDASDRIAAVSIAIGANGGADARVRALDAATGDEWWTTTQNVANYEVMPAMADIDGSGEVTILYLDMQRHLVALRADGSLRWRSGVPAASLVPYYSGIQLADLDRDGRAEVLVARSVFGADGTLRWQFPDSSTSYGSPLALDLDGDGVQEVLFRGETRRANGTLWWKTPSVLANELVTSAYYAPMPIDGGARAGVVVSEATDKGYRLSLLRPDGTAIWRIADGSLARAGLPLVADFVASSPGLEVFLAATEQMHASDGRVLWTLAGTTGSRAFNSSAASAADVDADGRLEIYTWSTDGLNVVNAQTGYVVSRLGVALPRFYGQVATFADPAGSGQARLWLGDNAGMTQYRPALGQWAVGARFVHQQGYAADRIGADMRVPPAQPGALPAPLNVFGAPAAVATPTQYLSDLRVFGPYAAGSAGDVALRADVVNRGTGTSRAFAVAFHNGMPASAGNLVGRVELDALAPGQSATATLPPLPVAQIGTGALVARVIAAPEEAECETRNNASSGRPLQIAVTDRAGLTTPQTWAIGYDRSRFAVPTFTATPPAAALKATENVPYTYTAQAATANIGDALTFSLDEPVEGAAIHARTGEITWTPRWGFPTWAFFRVRATSLSGQFALQDWWVEVARSSAPNTAPRITSSAPTQAVVGEVYEYPVVAVDDEGHAIAYTLTAAPGGMTIGAAGGLVRWTPASATPASVTVTVKATDARGANTTQTYTLAVYASPNRAPAIGSVPALTAAPTVAYTYALSASDPDGDALTTHWLTVADGATADASGIAWTPRADQVGEHAFAVEVRDGRGGIARQAFTVFVNDASSNGAPGITSNAPTTATAGQAYSYAVTATDPDNDTLTYRLATKPTGMTIAANAIAWTPLASQVGTHAVRVEVVDGRGGGAWQDVDIVVAAGSGGGGTGPNETPAITSVPPTGGKLGRGYRYDLVASDADGDTLVYSLQTAPAGMTIDSATGRIDWNPTAVGSYPVLVRVSDGRAWIEQGWTLAIGEAHALALRLSFAPDTVNPDEPVTVNLIPTNAAGQLYASLQLDGTPVTLDDLSAVVSAATPGLHTLAASVSDGVELANATGRFLVRAPEDADAPRVSLIAPGDDARITAPTDVRATIEDGDLVDWTLTLADTNGGTPIPLASGTTPVTDAVIGQLDPTLRLNGQYQLVLEATDVAGHRTRVMRVVSIDGDMKVGHFAITLEDVSIDVAGIPVRVTRTYDSRRAHESLDFGHGWTVDYANVRVHESRRLGFGWNLVEYRNGFFSNWCVLPNGDPLVTVTMPDGEQQRFKAKAQPECQMFVPQPNVVIVFEALPGTTAQLEQTDFGNVRLIDDRIAEIGSPSTPIDADQYRLTTADGLVWSLDQHFGLRQVRDPNDNTLTFTRDGVAHSSGIGVTFVRDGEGRIVTMRLPDDTERTYAYDTNGDLVSAIDAVDNAATYTYAQPQHPHYLKDIVDPRGVRASRSEYDADGRLVALIDADGRRMEFTHQIDARLEVVKNRRGHATTYQYDDNGWVLAETNALSQTTTRTYDADGNELTVTDPRNVTTTRTYDSRGNVLTERDGLTRTTTMTYDASNQLLTQVDPSQRTVVTNTYDARARTLLTTTDATGAITRFSYDTGIGSNATGELKSMTDAMGRRSVYYPHVLFGWRAAETDPQGLHTTYVHDTLGRVTSQVVTPDPNQPGQTQTTSYVYDDKGRLTSTTHPDGTTTATTYNAIDKPATECDAQDRCTAYTYDNGGNLQSTTYPDGTSESKTYDANGNVESETDRAGRTTRYVYDALDRLKTTILPDDTPADPEDNPFTEQTYDAAGRLVQTSNERGHTTTYGYDDVGRQTTVTDALNQVTTTVYDVAGRRTSVTDAAGRVTKFTYDNAGRLTETLHPDETPVSEQDNPRTASTYDALGRKTSETDKAGRITRYRYDVGGRLDMVVLPNPANGQNPALVNGESPAASGTLVTRYEYDPQGRKLRQIDALNRTTSWTYDVVGRVKTRTLPLLQQESFVYDTLGRRTQQTDFRGRTTSYAYKPNTDLLATIDYATDTDTTIAYTADGQIDSVQDGNGTTSYVYNGRGQLDKVTWPSGLWIEYGYDEAGNRTQVTTAEQSIAYTFDELSRLKTVTPSLGGGATYTYDAVGNRASVSHANGVTTTYDYYPGNQLKTLTTTRPGNQAEQKLSYEIDKSGLRTRITQMQGFLTQATYNYEYDRVKRLTREYASTPAATRWVAWTYDSVGNRLTQARTGDRVANTTYTVDANDRLTQQVTTGTAPDVGTTTYAYDNAGNLTQKTAPGGTENYVYDDANRMVELVAANQEVTRYAYNHNGIRIKQTRDATGSTPSTTHYLVDPNQAYAQVVEEHAQAGSGPKTLAALYTFGDDRISQYRPANGATAATVRHYHADGLGSTRLLTDGAGAVTDRYYYEAFGELETAASQVASGNDFLYTGEQLDPNSGFYYLRARYMDPKAGRFLTQDTYMGYIAGPVSLHKYIYGNADAVNGTDPSGYATLADFQTASAARLSLSVARVGRVGVGRTAANDAIFDAGLTSTQKGLLAIAATGAAGLALYNLLAEEEEDDDEPKYRLYHGTDIATARMLGAGAPISIEAENCNWSASCGGFYMADNVADAEHFAVFTQHGSREGGVVQYTFKSDAYMAIMGLSKKRKIPPAPRYLPMGNEIVLPPVAFSVFNGFLALGKIVPGPVTD